MTRLAIFDLDYTLTRQGTWGRFVLRSMKARPLGLPPLLLAAGWTQLRYKRGAVPRIAVKTAMMRRSMVGRTREELSDVAHALIADDIENGLNLRVLDALRAHQQAGDIVLIASAAVDLLVERYCEALDADGQVSTRMEWTQDDRLADHFASDNCYGTQKMDRIKGWLTERNLLPSHVTAYSDSRADAPMLEFADKAIIVAPKRKTRDYAQRMNFEIW